MYYPKLNFIPYKKFWTHFYQSSYELESENISFISRHFLIENISKIINRSETIYGSNER